VSHCEGLSAAGILADFLQLPSFLLYIHSVGSTQREGESGGMSQTISPSFREHGTPQPMDEREGKPALRRVQDGERSLRRRRRGRKRAPRNFASLLRHFVRGQIILPCKEKSPPLKCTWRKPREGFLPRLPLLLLFSCSCSSPSCHVVVESLSLRKANLRRAIAFPTCVCACLEKGVEWGGTKRANPRNAILTLPPSARRHGAHGG